MRTDLFYNDACAKIRMFVHCSGHSLLAKVLPAAMPARSWPRLNRCWDAVTITLDGT